MNRKILLIQPEKTRSKLSMSNPTKIEFLEWMTNVRTFSTLIIENSGFSGWTLSLQEPGTKMKWSAASDLEWSMSRSQHMCCAYLPLWWNNLTGRFTPSSVHQEWLSLLTSCYSHFSPKADVGISRLAFNARNAWTVPKWCQSSIWCYHDSLGYG